MWIESEWIPCCDPLCDAIVWSGLGSRSIRTRIQFRRPSCWRMRQNLAVGVQEAARIGIAFARRFRRQLNFSIADGPLIRSPDILQHRFREQTFQNNVPVRGLLTALIGLFGSQCARLKFPFDLVERVGLVEPRIRSAVRKMLDRRNPGIPGLNRTVAAQMQAFRPRDQSHAKIHTHPISAWCFPLSCDPATGGPAG